MKLNNRQKESSFAPLDNPKARRPAKPNPGGGLSRDRKARIVDMLLDLRMNLAPFFGAHAAYSSASAQIDAIIKEVER